MYCSGVEPGTSPFSRRSRPLEDAKQDVVETTITFHNVNIPGLQYRHLRKSPGHLAFVCRAHIVTVTEIPIPVVT